MADFAKAPDITSAPDFRKARARAAAVLRENHVIRPPVAPREIAESYGLTVQLVELPGDLNEVAGYIDMGGQTISVNAADPYNRKTFTIAHELGHYLLHRELFKQHPERYQVLMRRPIGVETDPLEKEANLFAAELLVPMEFLKLYGRYATPEELADLFAVSREVIGYRLKFANLAAVA